MRLTQSTPLSLLAAGLLLVATGCGDNSTPNVDTNTNSGTNNAGTSTNNNGTTSTNSGTSTNNSTTSTNNSTTGTNNSTTSTNNATTSPNNNTIATCEAVCDRAFACDELIALCPADALAEARTLCDAGCEDPDTRTQILDAGALECPAITPLIIEGFGLSEVCDGEDLCATTTCDPGAECNPDTGECVALSCDNGQECPPGSVCDEDTGACAPNLCLETQCEAGTECDPITGECVAIDLCADVVCEDGQACDPDTGECVAPDLCLEVTCEDGQICDPETGECVADPDALVRCEAVCDAAIDCAAETGTCSDERLDALASSCADLCADEDTRNILLDAEGAACEDLLSAVLADTTLEELCDPCNGVQCDPGFACNDGECVETDLCEGVECADDERCNPVNGECVPIDRCADVQCAPGERCDPVTGECAPVDLCDVVECDDGFACNPINGECVAIDRCADVTCDDNERCNPVNGECVPIDRCADVTCDPGFACDPNNGQCVPVDRCADVTCDPGFACNPTDGQCVPIDRCADVVCEDGFTCDPNNGQCIPIDRCATVRCQDGFICDPDTGDCVPIDRCEDVTCDDGERCDPDTGACVAIDRCADVTCDPGFTCDPNNGQCIPVDRCADVTCDPGFACNPTDGQCVPVDLCADVTCDPGFACDPNNGQCVEIDRCADVTCDPGFACDPANGECVAIDRCADVTCDPGFACNPTDGECIPLPCTEDGDCADGLVCNVPTGQCVVPDCTPDQLEPNDRRDTAVTLLGIDQTLSGLNICTDDSDWFAFDLPADQDALIDVLFIDADGDIDAEVFVEGDDTPLVTGVTGTDNERLPIIAVPEARTLFVRVYGFSGATNTYSLAIDLNIPGQVCRFNDQCPEGEDCIDNVCQPPPPCTQDSDCSNGFCEVETGICRECITDDQCGFFGGACEDFVCVDCRTDDDCFGGDVCTTDNTCVACLQDGDCNDGEVCDTDTNTCALADCTDALEPNDTQETGTNVPGLNITLQNLQICTSSDDDWFVLDVPANTPVRIDVRFIDANGDIDARLSDADGATIDLGASTSDDETLFAPGSPDDRTLFLRVYGYQDDLNTYDVEIATVACAGDSDCDDGEACDLTTNTCINDCSADIFEPNNTSQEASGLPFFLDTTNLCPGDIDWYTFTLEPNQQATVTLTHGSTSDVALGLFNDADPVQLLGSDIGLDTLEVVSPIADAPAAFFIRVLSSDPDAELTYTLDVAIDTIAPPCTTDDDCQPGQTCDLGTGQCVDAPTCDPDDFEPNDAFTAPYVLEPSDGTYEANLCEGADRDWYLVTIPTDQAVTILAEFTDAVSDIDIRARDLDNNITFDSSTSTSDNEQITVTSAQTDTFLLEVFSFSNDPSPYTLTLTYSDFCASDAACGQGEQCIDGACQPFVCQADEYEPNPAASPTTYEPGPFGTPGPYTICAGDFDWWRFDLEPNQGLEISMTYSANLGVANGRLAAANGTTTLDPGTTGPGIETFSLAPAAEARTVFLVVNGASGGTQTSYDFEATRTAGCFGSDECAFDEVCDPDLGACVTALCGNDGDCPDGKVCDFNTGACAYACETDALDPNDDQLQASPIDANTSLTDLALCRGLDTDDWFAVTVEDGERLRAEVFFEDDASDIDLELLDANGVRLDASTSTSDNELVESAYLTAGTYFVRVYAFSQGGNRYDLNVETFNTCDPDSNEPNDTADQASDLDDFFVDTTRLTVCPGDVDLFTFTAGSGDGVLITASFTHAIGDLTMSLLDANLEPVITADTLTDDEQIFYSVPEAGTFYIRIEGATPDAFNAYDIDIAIQ